MVELWTLRAEDLFAINDVGLAPWIPLTHFDGPTAELFGRCRDLIDRQAAPDEREALLVVTQLLAAVAHPDRRLLSLFTGGRPMIQSPLLEEIKDIIRAETWQTSILSILEDHFGPLPEDIGAGVRATTDLQRLAELNRFAARCNDLNAFRQMLRGPTS